MMKQVREAGQRAALLIALASGLAAAPAQAAVLSFNPSTVQVGIGNQRVVDVRISGLAAGQDLGAFDISVAFDASKLALSSSTLGSGLGDLASFEAFDFSAGAVGSGVVNLSEVSFLSDLGAQADAFTLATLVFKGLASGESQLSFRAVTLGDSLGNAVQAQLNAAAVSTVPEPGTPYLMLGAVALFFASRRVRK